MRRRGQQGIAIAADQFAGTLIHKDEMHRLPIGDEYHDMRRIDRGAQLPQFAEARTFGRDVAGQSAPARRVTVFVEHRLCADPQMTHVAVALQPGHDALAYGRKVGVVGPGPPALVDRTQPEFDRRGSEPRIGRDGAGIDRAAADLHEPAGRILLPVEIRDQRHKAADIRHIGVHGCGHRMPLLMHAGTMIMGLARAAHADDLSSKEYRRSRGQP